MNSAGTQSDVLFEKLRTVRRRLADREGLPPHFIFDNKSLRQMANAAPLTPDALLRVWGVGPIKLERYGEEFLREIHAHVSSASSRGANSRREGPPPGKNLTSAAPTTSREATPSEAHTAPEADTEKGRQRAPSMPRPPMPWVILAVLWVADWLIWLMLRPRSDERLVRPTKRVYWPYGLKQELMRRQNNICSYCGRQVPARAFEIDHMVPAYRGGSNDKENLQVLCRPCNTLKGIQTDKEFRTRYSKLVPSEPLTPPSRRISHDEFRAETERTSESDSLRKFKKSRFYTKSMKIAAGCTIVFGVTTYAVIVPLYFLGFSGFQLALPSVVSGLAVALGIWLRAYVTGTMIEDDS